jgi:hypothetical protein
MSAGLENRDYRRDPSRWPHGTIYPQKLALTSPTCGSRSVGIGRSRTQAKEFAFCRYVCIRIIDSRGRVTPPPHTHTHTYIFLSSSKRNPPFQDKLKAMERTMKWSWSRQDPKQWLTVLAKSISSLLHLTLVARRDTQARRQRGCLLSILLFLQSKESKVMLSP